jgi:hypothetical protein
MAVPRDQAELEAHVIVATLYGLHYDLIVTRDTERATAAFERVLKQYGIRVRSLAER